MREPIADLSAQRVVWQPGPAQIERSRALAFAREHGLDGWDALVEEAARNPAWFWGAVSEQLGLVWTQKFERVLDLTDGPEWPRWFVGGRMNYVTSAVDRWLPERADVVALHWEGEDGATSSLTFAELAEAVNRMANGLRHLGIGKGDRVGIYLPMLAETAIATLACRKDRRGVHPDLLRLRAGSGSNATE